MVNLIEGTDGRKMSSSWGNTINLLDSANDMFGKIMSISDELIIKYFVHCTRVEMKEVKKLEKEMNDDKLNPRDAKLRLAGEIVEIYHGEENARLAREYFINTFSKKEIPTDIAKFEIRGDAMKLIELLVQSKNATSLGDARRKIEQGGVSIDDGKIVDAQILITKEYNGSVLRIGKLGFLKIVFKK